MPLVPNRCVKHGYAHHEHECPHCTAEAYAKAAADSRAFFKLFGGMILAVGSFGDGTKKQITVEEVYQHFRMRLLEEKNQGR